MCHDPLGTFVIDPQVVSNPPMPVGRMLKVDSLNLLFEHQVFEWLLTLPIDVFAVNPQCFGTDRFIPGVANYFDFFAGACSGSVPQ